MTEAIAASINQATQLGVETTAGVEVPAIRRLGAFGINLSDAWNVGKQRARGNKYASGHPVNQRYTESDVEGAVAYNEIQYALAAIYSKPAVTDLVGAWAATTLVAGGEVVDDGTNLQVAQGAGGTTGATEPTWNTTPGGTTTGDGSVTWLNAGPSAGQTLNQMVFDTNTFGRDDVQTYTIEQIDTQRNRASRATNCVFSELTLESTRSDEMTIGGTVVGKILQRGATPTTAGIVAERPVFAVPADVNVYLDDSYDALGTTKLLANFGYNYSFSDRYNQAWVHDRSEPSWKSLLESEPSLTLELLLGEGAAADEVLERAPVGTRNFVRFESLGPEIWPGSGVRYAFVIDMCCQVNDSPSQDDEDDAYVVTIPLEAEHDEDWGRASRCRTTAIAAAL